MLLTSQVRLFRDRTAPLLILIARHAGVVGNVRILIAL